MKKKHWIKMARIAVTEDDFDTAYNAMRFIARHCKDVTYDPFVKDWMLRNNKQLVAYMMYGTAKNNLEK